MTNIPRVQQHASELRDDQLDKANGGLSYTAPAADGSVRVAADGSVKTIKIADGSVNVARN